MQLVINYDRKQKQTSLIIDASGRVVNRASNKFNKGMSVISVPANKDWPQGNYFIKVRHKGIISSSQFNANNNKDKIVNPPGTVI